MASIPLLLMRLDRVIEFNNKKTIPHAHYIIPCFNCDKLKHICSGQKNCFDTCYDCYNEGDDSECYISGGKIFDYGRPDTFIWQCNSDDEFSCHMYNNILPGQHENAIEKNHPVFEQELYSSRLDIICQELAELNIQYDSNSLHLMPDLYVLNIISPEAYKVAYKTYEHIFNNYDRVTKPWPDVYRKWQTPINSYDLPASELDVNGTYALIEYLDITGATCYGYLSSD